MELLLFLFLFQILEYSMCTGYLIVGGGYFAAVKEFPHMALIGYKNSDKVKWNCGGSLISEEFVLTAAHCLSHHKYGDAKVVWLGVTNIKHTTHLQELEVSETICYPEYTKNLIYHDIGLLRLSSKAFFNDYVKPVHLHVGEAYSLKSHLVVTGWGELRKDAGRRPENLMRADLEFFDTKKCNSLYKNSIKKPFSKIKFGILEELMICAGSTFAIRDTCQGDSGGPLQIHNGKHYVVIGVTSYGKACGLAANTPGIYTKVFPYLQWIENHVWPE